MLKIRLTRLGSKEKVFYRIVATDKNRKRSGKPKDIIGYWDPKKGEKKIDRAKLKYWRENGAVITKAVEKLL